MNQVVLFVADVFPGPLQNQTNLAIKVGFQICQWQLSAPDETLGHRASLESRLLHRSSTYLVTSEKPTTIA